MEHTSKQDIMIISEFGYRVNRYRESKAANKTVNCSMLLCNKGQCQDILTKWLKFQEFQDNWDPWIGYCGSCYEARLGGGKVFPGPTKSSGGLLKPKGDPAGSTTSVLTLADTAECASMVRCANNSLHLVVCYVFFVLCFCDTTLGSTVHVSGTACHRHWAWGDQT